MKHRTQSKFSRMLTNHRVRKGLSRKRVDFSDVVKDFYIEDGLAYISCNVKNYNEVIDHYSVREYEWPNKDFLHFVEDNAYYIPSHYPIVLELCGTHFTKKQQDTIVETLTDYYALRLGDTQLDVESNRSKEIILLLLTLLSAAILVIFGMTFNGDGILQETLLIVFWFFLWEWGDVVAFERGEVHMKKTDAAQLATMKIIFSDRFIDEPVDEEMKEEILEEIISSQ